MKTLILPLCLVSVATALAEVPSLAVSYNNVPDCDFSAKLTWDGEATVIERRVGTYGAWEPLTDVSGASSYNDTSAKAGVRYCYRLVNGSETGSPVEFRRLRRLETTGCTVVHWGDFTSQSWCKPPALSFDGSTGNDSYPDATTFHPQVGVNFGSSDRHVGYVRLYPRTTDGCQGRLNGTTVYGFAGEWSEAAENAGISLSESLTGASESKWYSLAVNDQSAYPIFYLQGAEGGNVNECEFYGWTDEDAAQEGPDVPPSDPVSPSEAELTLSSVTGSRETDFKPVLAWWPVNCPLTIQRKVGDGEWTVIGTAVANARSFSDEGAPVGYLCTYRLQAGVGEEAVDNYSKEQTYRRIRRLTFPNDTDHVFWGGVVGDGWYKPATCAFDGDVSTWPDLGGKPKVCVDFGAPTYVVACARVATRGDGCAFRLNGFRLFGSLKAGPDERDSSTDGTPLTDAVSNVPDSVLSWHELTVNAPAAYRTYYFAIENGNVAEVELYGWTLMDVGEDYVPPLTVVDNNTTGGQPDFTAHLTWPAAGATVTLQRAQSETGPWSDLVSTDAVGDWLDTTAACGVLYHYRLVSGKTAGASVTYRRLKKLDTSSCAFYHQGTADWGAENTGDKAFDGNKDTFPDLNYVNPKVIVDFGTPTVTVARIHVYPRTSYDPGRLNGATLYGSDKTGEEERATDELATALTASLNYNQGAVWYDLPVPDDKLTAYRTFYLKGNANGNVGECQLYGWTKDDLPKSKGLILIFKDAREN